MCFCMVPLSLAEVLLYSCLGALLGIKERLWHWRVHVKQRKTFSDELRGQGFHASPSCIVSKEMGLLCLIAVPLDMLPTDISFLL